MVASAGGYVLAHCNVNLTHWVSVFVETAKHRKVSSAPFIDTTTMTNAILTFDARLAALATLAAHSTIRLLIQIFASSFAARRLSLTRCATAAVLRVRVGIDAYGIAKELAIWTDT